MRQRVYLRQPFLSQYSLFNLDGPDGSLRRVHIGRVVHVRAVPGLQVLQDDGQFFERLALQSFAQLLVLRHRRQLIVFQHGLDVESRTAAEDRTAPPTHDVGIGHLEIPQILKEVIFRSRLTNIYQVIRHVTIVGQVLPRADVHAPIDLSRVSRDDFAAIAESR